MTEPLPDIARLLPHQPPMRLLDRVVGWEQRRVEAEVDVRAGASFFRPGVGIPAYVGVEYLAQAAAVCFALLARDSEPQGEAGVPRPGMLVACRRYDSLSSAFPDGAVLAIRVWPASSPDGALVRFAGEIHRGGLVASGELSVYSPAASPGVW